LATDVTAVFAASFARNRGWDPNDPDRKLPSDYGVVARLEDGVIYLRLTFRRGVAYCCYEHGCHHFWSASRRWEWLRSELTKLGLALPARLDLRVEVVIEEGAIFFDSTKPNPKRRGWYAFAPVAAREYQAEVLEAPEPAVSG
jgi:hypothetical protein